MLKNLLRLLASSASFVAVLLITNMAIAAPQLDNYQLQIVNPAGLEPVNLNLVSSTLELVPHSDNILGDRLGCSCAACTQAKSSINSPT